jgi:hypothetical protein
MTKVDGFSQQMVMRLLVEVALLVPDPMVIKKSYFDRILRSTAEIS